MRTFCLVLMPMSWLGLVAAGPPLKGVDWVEPKSEPLNELDTTRYQDCDDVRFTGRYNTSGEFLIYLNTDEPQRINCNFEEEYASTIIMQQKDGTVNFAKSWYLYKQGFHSSTHPQSDFWIGLDNIRALTLQGNNVLTVTMQDWRHHVRLVRYNQFFIGSETDGYRLIIGGYVSSTLPDDFGYNNGAQFATIDRPDSANCAGEFKSGWWYKYCTHVLPTGKYYINGRYTPPGQAFDGIYFADWLGYDYSLKYIKLALSKF